MNKPHSASAKRQSSRYDPSIDCEMAMVSAILLNPALIREPAAIGLEPEDFQTPEFGRLYSKLRNHWIAGNSWSEKDTIQSIQDCGIDRAMLFRLLETGHVYAHDLKFFVRRIQNSSRLSRLALDIDRASEVICANQEASADETIRILESALERIKADKSIKLFTPDQLATSAIADKEKPNQTKASFGIWELDSLIGGLHVGDLTVLAARASIGKTAFALQVCSHNFKKGRHVLFVSLEMGRVDIFDRLVAGQSGLSIPKIRSGRSGMSDEDYTTYKHVSDSLRTESITIFAPPKATVSDIQTACKIAKAKEGALDLVVVDYLSFIKHPNFRMDRRDQVGEICKQLKAMASELEVPIIALSQLNRQAEGEVPNLSMLRESGSVEEDADQVLFVHRQTRNHTDGKLIVAKNRHGQCGAIEVKWDGAAMRYFVDNSWQP